MLRVFEIVVSSIYGNESLEMFFVPDCKHPKTKPYIEWTSINETTYSKHTLLCEVINPVLNGTKIESTVKPYFDFDLKLPKPITDSETKLLQQCLVESLHSVYPGVSLDCHRYAWRAPKNIGTDSEPLWKYSFRFFFVAWSTTTKELKATIKNLFFSDVDGFEWPQAIRLYYAATANSKETLFDSSIYSSNRKMNCLQMCKMSDDDRRLEVFPAGTKYVLADYIITCLAGTEQSLPTNLKRKQPAAAGPSQSKTTAAKRVKGPIADNTGFPLESKTVADLLPQFSGGFTDAEVDSSGNIKFVPVAPTGMCTSNPEKTHNDNLSQSCVFYNTNGSIVATCFGNCGAKTLRLANAGSGSASTSANSNASSSSSASELVPAAASHTEIRDYIRNVLSTPFGDPEIYGKLDLTLGDDLQHTSMGYFSCTLPKNSYCPNCMRVHDKPENFCQLSSNGKFGVGCSLNHGAFYPNPSPDIARSLQIILFNNTTNNIVNNISYNTQATGELGNKIAAYKDFKDDGLPHYQDDDTLRRLFLHCLTSVPHQIAKYFHYLHCDEYRWTNGIWYRWHEHYWKPVDSVEELRIMLSSDEFVEPFIQACDYYSVNPNVTNATKKEHKIQGVIDQLGVPHFKSSVMTELQEVYKAYHPEFSNSTIDTKHLLPFQNGVLDLVTLNFRDGKQEDCMTRYSSIMYEAYTLEHKDDLIVREIEDWFKQTQPDEAQRWYLQKLLGLLLTDEVSIQEVFIWTGCGSNGKSFFMKNILKPILGNFYGTGQTTILTRKRENASQANEAMSNIITKRCIVFNEPAANEVIQADVMKNLSGEDDISFREMYGKQKNVEPTFKAILICNNIPKISENTAAVWRRIRVIDWPNQFVTDLSKCNGVNIFPKDIHLGRKISSWLPILAGMLVSWLKSYRAEGLFPPASVLKHTNQYKEENDEVLAWLKGKYYKTDSDKDKVPANDIYYACDNAFQHLILRDVKVAVKNALRELGFDEPKFTRYMGEHVNCYKKIKRF